MPAIMTHDFFGKDIYDECFSTIGMTADERDAFLLGNQGPDPLFYTLIDPALKDFRNVGDVIHHERPTSLICAMRLAYEALDSSDRASGRAYALGFLCHYLLDSAMHPLVYAEQYAFCDAGVEGLDRSAGSYVHAEIERDFDEMVLYTKLHRTVQTYKPYREVLRLGEPALEAVGRMYALVLQSVYGIYAPQNLYVKAVHDFRVVQHLFYSKNGQKAGVLGTVEKLATRKPYSLERAMAHRARAEETSDFDNRGHASWTNPFTKEESTDSFWDIYGAARKRVSSALALFADDSFTLAEAAELTDGLNFSGQPAEG